MTTYKEPLPLRNQLRCWGDIVLGVVVLSGIGLFEILGRLCLRPQRIDPGQPPR